MPAERKAGRHPKMSADVSAYVCGDADRLELAACGLIVD
jgi:hypothetical protein